MKREKRQVEITSPSLIETVREPGCDEDSAAFYPMLERARPAEAEAS